MPKPPLPPLPPSSPGHELLDLGWVRENNDDTGPNHDKVWRHPVLCLTYVSLHEALEIQKESEQ